MLETRRLGYWWANRMLQTTHRWSRRWPCSGMATSRRTRTRCATTARCTSRSSCSSGGATGNLRDLTIEVARNPAMLYFLDAQYNVKGAPNENFAREVMELFTMGVGNYTEQDVRECARAFTGWYFDDLAFKVDTAKHDAGAKTFLGRTGELRRRGRARRSSSSNPSPRSFWRPRSIASSCATSCRPRCGRSSAPCCATPTTSSSRS